MEKFSKNVVEEKICLSDNFRSATVKGNQIPYHTFLLNCTYHSITQRWRVNITTAMNDVAEATPALDPHMAVDLAEALLDLAPKAFP